MILLPFRCWTVFEDVSAAVFPGRPVMILLAAVTKLANFITLSITFFEVFIEPQLTGRTSARTHISRFPLSFPSPKVCGTPGQWFADAGCYFSVGQWFEGGLG
jgi:hypothetical protein